MTIRKILYPLMLLISSVCIADSGDPEAGKKISATCAACHGIDGHSVNAEWPKLAGQHEAYIVKQLQDYKSGKRVNALMAGIAPGLSDEDMRNLSAYFSTQKIKYGTANPDAIELGESLYRAGDSANRIPACMSCHGPAGKGNPAAMYPAMAGQHAAYTGNQLKMFKAEERANDTNAVMRTIAGAMTNAQIEAVAEYIQGLR